MSFNQSTYNANEDDRLVQIVLVLSHPVSTSTTITVSTTDISAKGKDMYIYIIIIIIAQAFGKVKLQRIDRFGYW